MNSPKKVKKKNKKKIASPRFSPHFVDHATTCLPTAARSNHSDRVLTFPIFLSRPVMHVIKNIRM